MFSHELASRGVGKQAVLCVSILITSLVVISYHLSTEHDYSLPNLNRPGRLYEKLIPFRQSGPVSALEPLCKQTTWHEGLWIQCHSYCGPQKQSICGGLNNARNRVQSCLRLAIDAGAGVILSKITRRDSANIGNVNGEEVCESTFFDTLNLQHEMARVCPQLKIRACADRSGIETVLELPRMEHDEASFPISGVESVVRETLKNNSISLESIKTNETALLFGDSHLSWNYTDAGELTTIRKELFKALRYNPELLETGTQLSDLLKVPYTGIHFRGEWDWPDKFGNGWVQIDHYVPEMQRLRNSTPDFPKDVYISCGDEEVAERLASKLRDLDFTVHTKQSLLLNGPPELAQSIESLGFDKKAIVEYQMMMTAKVSLSLITSTFGALIAYARTMDEAEDWYSEFVHEGTRREGNRRIFEVSPAMKGSASTRVMVLDMFEMMDGYP